MIGLEGCKVMCYCNLIITSADKVMQDRLILCNISAAVNTKTVDYWIKYWSHQVLKWQNFTVKLIIFQWNCCNQRMY